jgi:hypothetical protein
MSQFGRDEPNAILLSFEQILFQHLRDSPLFRTKQEGRLELGMLVRSNSCDLLAEIKLIYPALIDWIIAKRRSSSDIVERAESSQLSHHILTDQGSSVSPIDQQMIDGIVRFVANFVATEDVSRIHGSNMIIAQGLGVFIRKPKHPSC